MTYLYGKNPSTSNVSSNMLNILNGNNSNKFSFDEDKDEDEKKGYLKLMLDYYSILGGFGGIGGYIPKINSKFQFGVGYRKKTVVPIWLISIVVSLLSYVIVSFYLAKT